MSETAAETEVTPGYKTTEFWLGVGLQVLALLLAAGAINREQSDALGKSLEYLAAAAAQVGAAFFGKGYAESRAKVKAAALVARSAVRTAAVEAEGRVLAARAAPPVSAAQPNPYPPDPGCKPLP